MVKASNFSLVLKKELVAHMNFVPTNTPFKHTPILVFVESMLRFLNLGHCY